LAFIFSGGLGFYSGDVPGAQVNLMIDCSCDCIFSSVEGMLGKLKEAFSAGK